KPFGEQKDVLLNIVNKKELWNNLESALTVLSFLEPSPAALWKTLCEHPTTKKFCIRAWNAFKNCIDNQQLQGTAQERAGACLSAVRMISSKNKASLLDLFGKEELLFSQFEETEADARKQCAQVIYKQLLDICEDLHPNVHLDNVFKFREIIGKVC